jgi:outer membrane lipopolysaccharide assembly protein LptE/RlpB
MGDSADMIALQNVQLKIRLRKLEQKKKSLEISVEEAENENYYAREQAQQAEMGLVLMIEKDIQHYSEEIKKIELSKAFDENEALNARISELEAKFSDLRFHKKRSFFPSLISLAVLLFGVYLGKVSSFWSYFPL